jgi:aminoglycoside/choline kinase family phosphotransferase
VSDPRRDDPRLAALRRWIVDELAWPDATLAPASADASFRRYFRVTHAGRSWVAMDAPPGKEDVGPYLRIAGMLGDIGVHAPRMLEADRAQGFLLLTDLGSTTYLEALQDRARAEVLYADALGALLAIQARGGAHVHALPPYDEKLLRNEMNLFPEWFLGRHLQFSLDRAHVGLLADAFDRLTASALEQPRVFVHRDYHSRNLMVCAGEGDIGANPGILDFQDAVHGPYTYDLVSLLRDCYIDWPPAEVRRWAEDFRVRAAAAGIGSNVEPARFERWFDLMGVQRHLKAIGIFARLWHRDGKPGYLADIPRTLNYVIEACARHPDLAAFGAFAEREVRPALEALVDGPVAAGRA